MDRRTFAKGLAIAIPSAYIWVPKISIAKLSGDPREAIITARKVVTDNWELEAVKSETVASTSSVYAPAMKPVWAKLEENSYTKKETFSRSKTTKRSIAMTGSFSDDSSDYCCAYFKKNQIVPIAYISTVPFIMKGYGLQKARRTLSSSSTIEYFYPMEYVAIFDAKLRRNPTTPSRVIAQKAVWVTTYRTGSGRAGSGTFRITSRSEGKLIYHEDFEYDFS
ncbi:hypothetical protein [Methylobacterium aquaticum]|jgi:hypothetical protein|uniref:hypothetical protein n=1 Tax=Methylobacterium aquaticum TaxID=270351 RepID=UPI0012E25E12|nr:hypothetical protein [Methylobacterium aquaticum]